MSVKTINPDLGFVNEIIASGGESLKKCFQCATCSAVCEVSPDGDPFPRKEMLSAQWGLKDELFGSPDIWLCHQCNDCTAYCPRGAKPGDVLAAVRRMSVERYSRPAFLAKFVSSPRYLWLVLGIPVALLLAIVGALGNLGGVPRGEGGEIVYSHFIPVTAIDVVFVLAALFAAVVFTNGVMRYWGDLTGGAGGGGAGGLKDWQKKVSGGFLRAVSAMAADVLAHNRFRKCDTNYGRSTAHLLVLYSFAGLALTTTIAIIYLYGLGLESPYPLSDPMKVIGNISAAALVLGVLLVIINRVRNSEKAGIGGYYDWFFIAVIAGIAATGVLSEILRLKDVAGLAYLVYFVHLTLVFVLFAFSPYSKMAHMVYRTTAMVFEKMSGRDRP